MLNLDDTVTINGVAYPLSAYPLPYVGKLYRYFGGDPVGFLSSARITPDECPEDAIPLHEDMFFANGKPIIHRWYAVGVTTDRIDLDADGQQSFWEVHGYKGDALRIGMALSWCENHARGDWYARFRQVGGDVFGMEMQVCFAEYADILPFLEANEGARAA